MKIIPPIRSVLAALANTGAQCLQDLANALDPNLPARVYVTGDIWCYPPEHQHLVTVTSSLPDKVMAITRYVGITLAVIHHPEEESVALVLLNHRETPLAMYGRDPEGYPVDPEDYDIPRTRHQETPPADMDALIRTARALKPPANKVN